MTYQSFSNCNPLNHIDDGCVREFKIIIPKGKYITQEDIHFKIEYTNVKYDKIEKSYDKCLEKVKSLRFDKDIDSLKEYKTKINELIDSTIETIEQEYETAKERQTPLFMFQNIELYENEKFIARRMFSSLDDLIINGCLYLNQIFPGIEFKYTSDDYLMIRFTRAPFNNECLKFECHYNVSDISDESMIFGLITGYKEYLIPAGFYLGNINIEPDVESFKMVPCVKFNLLNEIDNKDYKAEAERLIKKYYNKMKFKYYKDGLEISKAEFGTSPGLYHIELLNKDELVNENDFKNNTEFHSIDYKIICEI